MTVRHRIGGVELRRSYSVCPPPDDATALRLVVKRLGPGGFGEYATTALAAGDLLEVSPPAGDFRLAEEPGAHHVLVAGGSGITPLLAMAAAALRSDPACRVSLVYANRSAASVLLAEELAGLAQAHPDRFRVLHVLSRESGPAAPPLSGRIDAARVPVLLRLLGVEPEQRPCFYLCGPLGLVESVGRGLADWGAAEEQVRFELFAAAPAADPNARPAAPAGARISVRLYGRTTELTMEPEDETVLDTLLRALPETPYSCREGLCGVCRTKVVAGSVRLRRQYALSEKALAAGYTLPCSAVPESAEVGLDFDA